MIDATMELLPGSRPETAVFGDLGVSLRISLSGAQEYATAQTIGYIYLARKLLVPISKTTLLSSGASGRELLRVDSILQNRWHLPALGKGIS